MMNMTVAVDMTELNAEFPSLFNLGAGFQFRLKPKLPELKYRQQQQVSTKIRLNPVPECL